MCASCGVSLEEQLCHTKYEHYQHCEKLAVSSGGYSRLAGNISIQSCLLPSWLQKDNVK